jgi:hypothetical protein
MGVGGRKAKSSGMGAIQIFEVARFMKGRRQWYDGTQFMGMHVYQSPPMQIVGS